MTHDLVLANTWFEKNFYLNQSARDAFRSYLQSYATYHNKRIFDVDNLDLAKIAKSFGFKVPPKVNLAISSSK